MKIQELHFRHTSFQQRSGFWEDVCLWLSGDESACSAGDTVSIPGSGRFPRERHGNPLQYSCLENPIESQRSLLATVHRIAKSQTGLKQFSTICLWRWE